MQSYFSISQFQRQYKSSVSHSLLAHLRGTEAGYFRTWRSQTAEGAMAGGRRGRPVHRHTATYHSSAATAWLRAAAQASQAVGTRCDSLLGVRSPRWNPTA
jgi:hypothetical protein